MNGCCRFLISGMWMVCVLLMVACSSSPGTQYYVLDSIPPDGQPAPAAADMVIQVEVPPYLDRPGMVYRQRDNQLHIDEYHQWGGHLRDNIASTLAQNLAGHLASARISVAPALHMTDRTVMLSVRIRAFERMPDGHVYLSAYWQMLSHGEVLYARSEELRGEKTLAEQDYAGMAASMSSLLARFSEHIARAVRAHLPS